MHHEAQLFVIQEVPSYGLGSAADSMGLYHSTSSGFSITIYKIKGLTSIPPWFLPGFIIWHKGQISAKTKIICSCSTNVLNHFSLLTFPYGIIYPEQRITLLGCYWSFELKRLINVLSIFLKYPLPIQICQNSLWFYKWGLCIHNRSTGTVSVKTQSALKAAFWSLLNSTAIRYKYYSGDFTRFSTFAKEIFFCTVWSVVCSCLSQGNGLYACFWDSWDIFL